MKPLPIASEINPITLGARASKLSIKQVEELVAAITYHYPKLRFKSLFCQTKGDIDQKTSLRDLGATDFFTQELDRWVLEGTCDIALHSAKDLPNPLPENLEIIALTEPLNEEDVIVLHPDIEKDRLNQDLTIATSSIEREKRVKTMLPEAKVVDLRGSIDQRLKRVYEKEVDGAVIAKVALMRLGYDDLNVIKLIGKSTQGQGSLAVVAKKGSPLKAIFERIDYRLGKSSLYFGLDPSRFRTWGKVTHRPLIQTQFNEDLLFLDWGSKIAGATHLLLTSRTSVKLFFEMMQAQNIPLDALLRLNIIAVGMGTRKALIDKGLYCSYVAQNESQEGIVELIGKMGWKKRYRLLYLKSAQARAYLTQFFEENQIHFEAYDLYQTLPQKDADLSDISDYKEVVFSSSSCVKTFFDICDALPSSIVPVFKGQVTQKEFKAKNPQITHASL